MTQNRLKKLLHYDIDTGVFTRLTDASCKTKIGDIAGGVDAGGYLHIRVDGKRMKAHRLAFLYMIGYIPTEVDHINHNKLDNSWFNLREATRAEQNQNHTKRKDNKSGVTGVCWSNREHKWKAKIGKVFLGTFIKFSDAVDARKLAEVAYGYHENHGGKKQCL